MKKLIALLLAAVMLLSMTACGGAAEPAETAAPATEPVMQATEAPTEEPTVAPTEDPNAYTAYTLGENESYVDVVWAHDFWEVDMTACVAEAERYGAKGGEATPLSLELSQNGFRMEVDYTGYDYMTNKVIPYGTVELIGAKGDGPADISGINDRMCKGSSYFENQDGVTSEFGSFADGHLLTDTYWHYNIDSMGNWRDLIFVAVSYYASTNNLYNIVYRVSSGVEERGEPTLLARIDSQNHYSPFRPTVQTLTYGNFNFEMSRFAIQCGDTRYIYNYRPGMSLSDWACSELNTDGWIPWYGMDVLSPDRAYVCSTLYFDIAHYGNLIVAEEYDNSTNALDNSFTETDVQMMGGASFANSSEFGGEGGTIDEEALQKILDQYGFDADTPILTGTVPDGTSQDSLTNNELGDMITTEENAVAMYGNITVPVAHMVNAKTPLYTPGFRVIGKDGGRLEYHSVEIGEHYLLDDILDIYMNGITDELIPHIKLYAFPESEEFMDTLGEQSILDAHPNPLEQGDAMLTIPENAVCLTFQRVPDGEDAPDTPNPREPSHENVNKDAVYARYVTKDDPNFGEGVNLVFAITFDDELVYWIHMGSRFNENNDNVTWVDPRMPL